MKLNEKELDNLLNPGIRTYYLDMATKIYINQVSQMTGVENATASEVYDLCKLAAKVSLLSAKAFQDAADKKLDPPC